MLDGSQPATFSNQLAPDKHWVKRRAFDPLIVVFKSQMSNKIFTLHPPESILELH